MTMREEIADMVSLMSTSRSHDLSLADDIIAALPDMIAPQWQPIETAPKDGTHFLAYEEDGSMYRAAFGRYEMLQSFCGQFVTEPPEPTHWISLPHPPKATS